MNNNFYQPFLDEMAAFPELDILREVLSSKIASAFDKKANGNLVKWLKSYHDLPELTASTIDLNCSVPVIGRSGDIVETDKHLEKILKTLLPWRKGPFELFGIHIDTEWHSDFKWDRLKNHISDLKDRIVLDIGCGNGYHCLRMAGSGARLVVGIDTGMLSVIQFKILQKYMCSSGAEKDVLQNDQINLARRRVEVFPIAIQEVPDALNAFDTVFSMGVIYHRPNPLEHLLQIKSCLKPGGEIVLETLVVDGDADDSLVPEKRYAQMRNVWQIPSVLCAEKWMREAGFCEVRTVDVTVTTTAEQRSTEWMQFHSLQQFLDPQDSSKTIEGYQAPKRAILIGQKQQ